MDRLHAAEAIRRLVDYLVENVRQDGEEAVHMAAVIEDAEHVCEWLLEDDEDRP